MKMQQVVNNMIGLGIRSVLVYIAILLTSLTIEVTAQDMPPFFIDENGDGFNDNAPDHDGDGIPNRIDPDYRRMFNITNSSVWKQLTEAQQQEILALIESMQNSESDRTDIQTAIADKLTEWGLEIPENFGRGTDLTNQQRIQIREMVQTMRGQGASQEDIRSAIADQLGEWGINAPAHGLMGGPRQSQGGRFRGRRP